MTLDEENELRGLIDDLIGTFPIGESIDDAEAAVEQIVERVRQMVVERQEETTP